MPDITGFLGGLTIEEKAALCSGADFWHTVSVHARAQEQRDPLRQGLLGQRGPDGADQLRIPGRSERRAERVLDQAAGRVLELVARVAAPQPRPGFDADAHHILARHAASHSAVLLKNSGTVLPLDLRPGATVAVIGEFARTPGIRGQEASGLSHAIADCVCAGLGRAQREQGRRLGATGDVSGG